MTSPRDWPNHSSWAWIRGMNDGTAKSNPLWSAWESLLSFDARCLVRVHDERPWCQYVMVTMCSGPVDHMGTDGIIYLFLKHYWDLLYTAKRTREILISNIHLLSPQKWSHIVHFNIEKVFLRGQPWICPGFSTISQIKLRLGAQSVTLLSTLRDPTQLRRHQCACACYAIFEWKKLKFLLLITRKE
jgi:hypothetical protein